MSMADHLLLPLPRVVPSRRQLSTGGGSVPGRNPRRHGEHLRIQLDHVLSVRFRAVVEGVDPRMVFKLAATSRLSDDELRRRGLQLLGDTPDWTYMVIPVDVEADEFRSSLAKYEEGEDEAGGKAKYRGFFEVVADLVPYGPEDRHGPGLATVPDNGEPFTVDVTVWPSPTAAEAANRLRDVQTVLAVFEADELSSDDRPQTTMIRARVSLDCLKALLELMVVEQIRTPIAPFLSPSEWLTAQIDDLAVPDPLHVVVGVIDDGFLAGHPLLRDLVVGEDAFPSGHTWPTAGQHGTMVAGLAAYGDFEVAVRDGLELPRPATIHGARVLQPDPNDPLNTIFPTDVPTHRVIEDAIRSLHAGGVRIFNLSITDREPFRGPHASLLTETIDRLVSELDIVVVVAAGNRPVSATGELEGDRHALHDYPAYTLDDDARLAEPAIASNAVVVGSTARSGGAARPGDVSHARDRAIAQPQELSPFSRTGPGMGSAVKPDVVAPGGNSVWSSMNRVDMRNLGAGIVSLVPNTSGRLFGGGSGTSFAAPRVAHVSATILDRYPGASANLVRALLGLSSELTPAALEQLSDDDERLRAFGFGEPVHGLALDSDDARVVMFYEGVVDVDTVAIHPLPVPEAFARGRAERSISIALAFDPPVRRQRREYIAASMRLDLYRAIDIDKLAAIVQRQDSATRVAMINNRSRATSKLKPGTERLLDSTLQVRRWRAAAANSLSPDDGDTYFLVVSHTSAPWAANLAGEYETQKYAVAVALSDRDRPEVELYNLVQQQVRIPARARVRLQ